MITAPVSIERRFGRLAAGIRAKGRRLGTKGTISADDLALIYLAQEGLCAYCGTEVTPDGVSFDHVIPYARGGSSWPENIVACCITCQRTKFTKSVEELQEWMALRRTCSCGVVFRPRWADVKRGLGFYHSRVCSGRAGGLAG
jgi:hypothetical protein